jgi:hypothetical protein
MRIAALLTTLLVAAAAPVAAQTRRPLPAVVADVRGFYSGLGRDAVTAEGLSVPSSALPARGFGGVAGVHVYPFRGRTMALGFGGELVLARGRAVPELDEDDEDDEDDPATARLPINQQIRGFSGTVSLNFGHRDGWSYVSGGMGPLSFATYAGDRRPPDAPVQMTINFGAGARWFAWRHFAFTFDLRYYQTEPEVATSSYPGRQRQSLRVLSAGVSIR